MERDIDMGQTVEEAAKLFANRCRIANFQSSLDYPYDDIDMINAFKAGAEWQAKQSPWISVKDKLPYDIQGDKLLIRYLGKYGYDICIGMFIENGNFIDKSGNDVYNVIQYMPIPSLDEILESSQRCAETD